ncbi:MAG TPA: DNA cytosine methyltransferase [Thermoanaerobaculia bacterium]|jgi:DNA (cytosine-5)-methyltransferase 1
MAAKPIAIELFCGAGGMSLGFKTAGFRIAAAVDNNVTNVKVHKQNFRRCETITADLSTLSGADLLRHARVGTQEKLSVLFGGPPCQGFSVGGKHDSADPRNQLLGHFGRLLDELRPEYFVVENVAGLTLEKHQQTLSNFLARVRAAGYSYVDPIQVLDAADYGVPQSRRRVFILGARIGNVLPKYPAPTTPGGTGPTAWDALADLALIDERIPAEENHFTGTLGIPSAYALRLRMSKRRALTLSGCARSKHTSLTIERFSQTTPGTAEPISRFFRLAKDRAARTLRAGTGPENGSFTAPRPIHPVYPRCITVREAARLHSFPDSFQFDPTIWHAFRQIGNSVPPLLAEQVAREVMTALRRSGELARRDRRNTTPSTS